MDSYKYSEQQIQQTINSQSFKLIHNITEVKNTKITNIQMMKLILVHDISNYLDIILDINLVNIILDFI